MITAFVDMLGLAMTIPLLPFYAIGGISRVVFLLTTSMEDYAATRVPSMT